MDQNSPQFNQNRDDENLLDDFQEEYSLKNDLNDYLPPTDNKNRHYTREKHWEFDHQRTSRSNRKLEKSQQEENQTERKIKIEKQKCIKMNEKLHNIYQKHDYLGMGDLWEIVLAEQFQKVMILRDKLSQILQEVQDIIHEIRSQKKTLRKEIKTYEKLKAQCQNQLKQINNKLKNIVESEEQTLENNFSFCKQEELSNIFANMDSVEDLEKRKLLDEGNCEQNYFFSFIQIIKDRLEGKNCALSEDLINNMTKNERIRSSILSIDKNLSKMQLKGRQFHLKQHSRVDNFLREFKEKMSTFLKKILNSPHQVCELLNIIFTTNLTFIQFLIEEYGGSGAEYEEKIEQMFDLLNLLQEKSHLKLQKRHHLYISGIRKSINELNSIINDF